MQSSSVSSSRVPFGCLIVFGLPFAAMGLLSVYVGVRDYGTKPNAIVPVLVGSIFTVVGLGIMVGGWYGTKYAARTDAVKASRPNQPWMWREDWASGVIKDSNKAGTIFFWVFALLWNAVAFPIGYLAIPKLASEGKGAALLVGLFPFIGVILLIAAIYQTLRSMKFGTSKCRLERVPIVPGRAFRGEIELNSALPASHGIRLRLASIRAITSGTGKNRSTTEHLLWDREIVADPIGMRIPFQFATPPDAECTNDTNSNDRYLWRLSASADVPGVDYAATFDVPVFQTGEIADGSEFEAFEQKQRAAAARQTIAPTSGVEITPLPGGGEQYRLRAKKTFGGVLQSILFLVIWNAAIYAMLYFHAPWGFPAVFIAIDLLLLVATVDYFLGVATIRVDRSGVQVRKTWLGLGPTSTHAANDIDSIGGTTPSPNAKSFAVTMKLRDGKTHTLTSYLGDRETADTVAAKMMGDLGR